MSTNNHELLRQRFKCISCAKPFVNCWYKVRFIYSFLSKQFIKFFSYQPSGKSWGIHLFILRKIQRSLYESFDEFIPPVTPVNFVSAKTFQIIYNILLHLFPSLVLLWRCMVLMYALRSTINQLRYACRW